MHLGAIAIGTYHIGTGAYFDTNMLVAQGGTVPFGNVRLNDINIEKWQYRKEQYQHRESGDIGIGLSNINLGNSIGCKMAILAELGTSLFEIAQSLFALERTLISGANE